MSTKNISFTEMLSAVLINQRLIYSHTDFSWIGKCSQCFQGLLNGDMQQLGFNDGLVLVLNSEVYSGFSLLCGAFSTVQDCIKPQTDHVSNYLANITELLAAKGSNMSIGNWWRPKQSLKTTKI